MTDTDRDHDRDLDALLAKGRAAPPMPNASFLDRLEADMEAARPVKPQPQPETARSHGWLLRARTLFAASGLGGAAALGVWIGLAMPEVFNDFAADTIASDSVDLGAFLTSANLAALDE